MLPFEKQSYKDHVQYSQLFTNPTRSCSGKTRVYAKKITAVKQKPQTVMPIENGCQFNTAEKWLFSHSFSYLPFQLQEFVNQHHSPFITSLPYFQILPTFCLFFLKYSLTLQAMQLQVFFSHFKDCVFLLSAPLANSSCPFTHLPRMMSGQFSVVIRLGKSRECEVALLFFQ